MKSNFTAILKSASELRSTALAFLLCAGAAVCEAAPSSPISPAGTNGFTWDCLLSGGGQQGIAQITFNTDYTLVNNELDAIVKTSPPDNSSGRNPGGGTGRSTSSSTNSTPANTNLISNLFGFTGAVQGVWSYDDKGRVIGYFSFPVSVPAGSTNYVTNAISFTATVVPNKRITLLASTTFGKVTYTGVPLVQLTNLNNSNWYGTKTQDNQWFLEFFTLTQISPNLYSMNGTGAGYSYNNGICLVSKQNKIGFVAVETAGTNYTMRSTIGSFSSGPKKTSAQTKGINVNNDTVLFNATVTPYPH